LCEEIIRPQENCRQTFPDFLISFLHENKEVVMFGLMKNLIKENAEPADTVTLGELYTGCMVGFGFMPQKNISGKRVPVSEVNSYLFEPDNFLAYRLESDTADVNLIIADEDDGAGMYLAISQRIEPRLFESVFTDHAPQYWFALGEGESMEVNTQVLGSLQGWLAPGYTLAVATKGRLFEGDYRLRKSADRGRFSKVFDYVLLVDEDNEYALEAEKYEDGTLSVFATIYRPGTDIGEITRARKSSAGPLPLTSNFEAASVPLSLSSVDKIAHEPPTDSATTAGEKSASENMTASEVSTLEAPAGEPKAPEAVAGEPAPALKSGMPEAVRADAAAPDEVVAAEAESKAESLMVPPVPEEPAQEVSKPEESLQLISNMSLDIVPLRSKFGRIQLGSAPEQGNPETLACDLPLAGRLIDEAQRNQILLSELIRKVIDLPARVSDQVLIPFTLDDAEQAELARRYNLPAGDLEAVKQQILEELKRFVGNKK
jgi:hypothetical protein